MRTSNSNNIQERSTDAKSRRLRPVSIQNTNFSYDINYKVRGVVRFPFDGQWVKQLGSDKRISIRKVGIYPAAYTIHAYINDDPKKIYSVRTTTKTTVAEIMTGLCTYINENIANAEVDFDLNVTDLLLRSNGNDDITIFLNIEFLEVLNQPYQMGLNIQLSSANPIYKFTNVWDRERLFLHASFSTDNREFCCEVPYDVQILDNFYRANDLGTYNAWFTVDGKNIVDLLYDFYLIKLELFD